MVRSANMQIQLTELDTNPVYADEIAAFRDRASDFLPAFLEIVKVFWMNEEGVWTASGPGWAPLAASTVAKKGSSEILVETGALEESLEGGTGSVVHIEALNRTSQSVYMGTSVTDSRGKFYAGFQQYGFTHASGMKVPPRAPINLLPATIIMWDRILRNWLTVGDPVSI